MIRQKNILIDLIEYAIIVLSILISATMWSQKEILLINPNRVRIVLLVLILFWAIICKIKLKRNQIFYFIFICFCALMCVLTHINYASSSIVTLIPVLFMCFWGLSCDSAGRLQFVCRKFVNVLCIMALLSLLFYTFVFLFRFLSPTGFISLKWSWRERVPSYYNLFYDPMPNGFSFGSLIFHRNCGIYPEAPMFMYILVLALLINKLVLHDNKSKKNVLLVITIFSTVSITGYIIVVLLYSIDYIFLQSTKKHVLLMLMIPFILTIGLIIVYYLFFNKLDTNSGAVRSDHVFASFKAFFSTNMLGCGIGNADYVMGFMENKKGISVGLPYLLATGGIFWGAIFFIPLLKCVIICKKAKEYEKIVFSLLFTLLLFMTACHSYMHTWLIFGTTVFIWSYSKQDISNKQDDVAVNDS